MTGIQRPVNSYDAVALNTLVGTENRLKFWLVRGLDEAFLVRGKDTIVPGAAGRTPRNRVRDNRLIEVRGLVRGIGASDAARADDYRDAMEVLRALFAANRAAATLIIGLEDGVRTATISARPLPETIVNYKPVPSGVLSYQLEAVGDDWLIA
jgi:hypothetical protein